MTRINTVPVEELTDQHLLAEWRELPRISKLAWAYWGRDGRKEDLPETYRLGKGHVQFFYDKGTYLYFRLCQLYEECQARGIKVQYWSYVPHPDELSGGWTPDVEAIRANRARRAERILQSSQRATYKGSALRCDVI